MVCLLHGLGEHTGRYQHVAAFLTERGYSLMGNDLRGHGRSEGQRGHVDSFEQFMQDIDLQLKKAAEIYPEKCRFLYGHSLGGLLALNYALRRQPQLAGIITTGAGLRSSLQDQKVKIAVANLISALTPKASLATGLKAEHLSRDPEVVRRYQADSLVHDRSTFRMAKETLASMPWALAHAAEFPPVPLLIMHGKADQLTYPSGSQDFARQVQGEVTLKLWDGLYHEVHNEPEGEQVLAFLADWLDSHCKER